MDALTWKGFVTLQALQKYAEASVDLRNLLAVDPNNSAAKKEINSIAALWKQVME